MLKEHPEALIVADEAYFEFIDRPYTDLLSRYNNLIILRTFSKTMGAAGLRIGYMIADSSYIDQFRKVRLPFLLNEFSLIAAKEVLSNPEMKRFREKVVSLALSERERLYGEICSMENLNCEVKRPFANFLLVRFSSQDEALRVYEYLITQDIIVRNVSAGPGLTGCLRISVGSQDENTSLIKSLKKFNKN
jgi:histidinol-phosphate aminotransferase